MTTDLQQQLDASMETSGHAVRAIFGAPGRSLSAEKFRELWRGTRMFAVATAGKDGMPHIAPVHVLLRDDDQLEMAIFEDSVRYKDLQRDPRIAITTWTEDGRIAIVYGEATEVPDSRREMTRGEQKISGRWLRMMRIEIKRAYAMDPRAGTGAR